MADIWKRMRDEEAAAEVIGRLAALTPVAHWSSSDQERGYKAYEVRIKDKLYGTVYQTDETTYKKAGRLRYGDRKVKRWTYDPEGFFRRVAGIYYTSRKRAIQELMLDHLREPARKKEELRERQERERRKEEAEKKKRAL
jgi:hypothetical protein